MIVSLIACSMYDVRVHDPSYYHQPGTESWIIFETLNAYQRSAALKAAIELDVFSKIAEGSRTADAIAQAVGASSRGIRILCDFLVVIGFLSKSNDEYSLSVDSAMFLDRKSPAYFGGTVHFLLDPRLISSYPISPRSFGPDERRFRMKEPSVMIIRSGCNLPSR